jgi:hypothetical protein
VNSAVKKVVVVDFVAGKQEAVESIAVNINLPDFRSPENVSVNDFFQVGVLFCADCAVLQLVL